MQEKFRFFTQFILFNLFFLIILTAYPASSAECEFYSIRGVYRCIMTNASVPSADSHLEISGEHTSGHTDADVQFVFIKSSNIRYLQSTIFEKFTNLVEFVLVDSGVEVVMPDALKSCKELEIFNIDDRTLGAIPARLFQNCTKLEEVIILGQIKELVDETFYGLGNLENLDLSGNQLTALDSNSFKGLIRLRHLNLAENKFSESRGTINTPSGISADTFLELFDLIDLNLMGTDLSSSSIPETLFTPLKNLEILDLRKNSITSLNHTWFQHLSLLRALDLSRNSIDSLPSSIFAPLINLHFVYLDQNHLKTLESASFGYHQHLRVFTVDHNEIRSIELGFFDSFPALEYFHAIGNECINGFLNGHEEPIDFEDVNVKMILDDCYGGGDAGGGRFWMWLWIGLGVIAGICVIGGFGFWVMRKKSTKIFDVNI